MTTTDWQSVTQPDATPACGPPWPWDCSILEAVGSEAVDPPARLVAEDGAAALPPFIGKAAATDARVAESAGGRAWVPDGPPASLDMAWLLGFLLAALALLGIVLRRSARRRRLASDAPDAAR